MHPRIGEGNVLGPCGHRAGGDQDDVALQPAVGLTLAGDPDRVRVFEHGAPVDQVDLVPVDVLGDDVAEGANDLLLAVH